MLTPSMSDIPEFHYETFQASVNPSGVVLELALFPRGPGSKLRFLVTLSTSVQSLKGQVYLLHRMIRKYESDIGAPIAVIPKRLDELKVAREDWSAFWER